MVRTQRRQRSRVPRIPPGTDLDRVAAQARYEGSAYHKDAPSFVGQPKPRPDASICPRDLDRQTANEWLRSAIRNGMVAGPWDGGFPGYVWYRDGDTVFEGRLTNRGLGAYKGYPLDRGEWPKALVMRRVDH